MTQAARALLAALLLVLLVAGCAGPRSGTATVPSASAPTTSAGPDADPVDVSCPATSSIPLAKTKFALHAGLAFGAFHHYLWRPFREGTFGRPGRLGAFVAAGLAALFVKHEVRLAGVDAKADPALCRQVAAPLGQIGDSVQSAVDRLKNGDAGGVTDVNSAIGAVENAAGAHGSPITENDNPDISSPH